MDGHRQTCVLKLKPSCCTECMRKVRRRMLKVEGVHSIKVNAKEGTIEVESEIDPKVLIAMAAKAGKRAELLGEPRNNLTATPPPPPPPHPPPPVATPSTDVARQRQVNVNKFDGFDQTVNLQDLVDKNGRGIKHMEIIDKRVIKIAFKESNDDTKSDHSPSSDPKRSDGGGGGEASGSGNCGISEVAAATPPPHAPEPPCSVPPEINDVPIISKPAEPPVANVNYCKGGYGCLVM